MAWMRRENVTLLEDTFPRGSRLLEIGCGTGDEALYLARRGRIVLATDISPRMAAETLAKARGIVSALTGVTEEAEVANGESRTVAASGTRVG
jgi:cyclopropane fatty-acyl-phospholipid synthase-like methyltransferase